MSKMEKDEKTLYGIGNSFVGCGIGKDKGGIKCLI